MIVSGATIDDVIPRSAIDRIVVGRSANPSIRSDSGAIPRRSVSKIYLFNAPIIRRRGKLRGDLYRLARAQYLNQKITALMCKFQILGIEVCELENVGLRGRVHTVIDSVGSIAAAINVGVTARASDDRIIAQSA
jgi:hypothetical protein